MNRTHLNRRAGIAAALALVLAPALASAAEVTAMISGAFRPAFLKISGDWAKRTGNTVAVVAGPSIGAAPEAIPNRLKRGEAADLVIVSRISVDQLSKDGYLVPGTQVDLIDSLIGLGVKTGHPIPDISTLEGFKKTLIAAKSIAYSDSNSGVYIERQMYKDLGLPELAKKSRMIPVTPVGEILVKGEAEIGFQQISELMAVPGVTVVGPIPKGPQQVTVFSGGIATKAKHPAEARALLAELQAPKNYAAIRSTGVEPSAARKP